jgi:glycosyltransferase involved in cell wall biosynthesis
MDSFYDISIVIIDRNTSLHLERCIRSCIAQTYPGRAYELMLIHSGTNEIVDDILSNYNRRHAINSYVSTMEPADILQSAIKHSTGRFLVFIDSEDYISDYMLLCQTIFLYDNPSFNGVLVDYWIVNRETDVKMSRVVATEQPILQGTMFKKDLLLKLSRSEGPKLVYDPEMLKEVLLRNGKFGYLPISFYRKSVNPANS